MSQIPLPNSLVLYKHHPARVMRVEDKIEIELDSGKSLSVRPKDISLLHPGPLHNFHQLQPPSGDVETAWELLAGTTTTLPELAELIYDTYTPATAWATWQWIADGLYFQGRPEEIRVCSAAEVAQTQAERTTKANKEQEWAAFFKRVQAGQLASEDSRHWFEVEQLALGQQDKSHLLRELNRAQSPENAHALLLQLGYWNETVNPYPQRWGVATTLPDVSLPELPAETRLDLTHLPTFAIDDEGAQDPDDALSLDGERLWVHVADVAAFIAPGSPADLEAQARGANLYLPEGTLTMLPPQATGQLALGLAEISPALSFGLDVSPEGQVTLATITPSWVRVQRLSYEQTASRLHEAPFDRLHRLAQISSQRRQGNGALELELPEVKIRLIKGEVIIKPLPPLLSRELVREAMLMTGEAVARFALAQNIAIPFTTQEAAEVIERPHTLAEMFACRRLLKRSQLSRIPAPHAGLGLELYAQVTSPLRRYADLVIHQQLRAFLRNEPLLTAAAVLERVGAAEAVSGSVRQAERQANKHWTLVYLLRQPAWQGQGVVVEQQGQRSRLLIPELDLETQLHLPGPPALNSVISLKLSGVNLAELEAYFQVS